MPTDSPSAWVIAFCSQKGGVGKTTLARGLATYLDRADIPVQLVDSDVQQSMVEWNTTRRRKNPAGALTVAEAANFDDFKGMLSGKGWIIVDAPGRASKTTLALARVSHLAVQPTGGSIDDMLPGERVFTELVDNGIPRERLAFALSRIDLDSEERGTRDYLSGLGYAVIEGALHNRSGYKTAQNSGKSVIETNFESLNAKAEEIIKGIIKHTLALYEPAAGAGQGIEKQARGAKAKAA